MASSAAKGTRSAKADGKSAGAKKAESARKAQAPPAGAGAASGGRFRAKRPERGVCIICGMDRIGKPAAPELPLRAARRLRRLLRLPEKHTVACSEHEGDAAARRAKFERKVRDYLIVAALFFAFASIGGFYFGRADLGLFVPAFLGAAIIALLPIFYYSPSFGK